MSEDAAQNHIPLLPPDVSTPAMVVRNVADVEVDIGFGDLPENLMRVSFDPPGHPAFRGINLYHSIRPGAAFADRLLVQPDEAFDAMANETPTWRSMWSQIALRSDLGNETSGDESSPRILFKFPPNHTLIALALFMNDDVCIHGHGRMTILPEARSVVPASGGLVAYGLDLAETRVIALKDSQLALIETSGMGPQMQLASGATMYLSAKTTIPSAKVAAESPDQIAILGTDIEYHSVEGVPPRVLKDGHQGALVRNAALIAQRERGNPVREILLQADDDADTSSNRPAINDVDATDSGYGLALGAI